MKTILTILGAAALLTGCSWLTPEQSASVLQTFAQMRDSGQISSEQYDALQAAISAGDWSHMRDLAVGVGLSIAGSLTGVRVWRGGVNARKGQVPPAS